MSFTRLTLSLYLLAVLALQAAAQHTMFPPVRGTREMVGAANNLEVEAGFRILEQGGNAVDAGVAATLAAAVTVTAPVTDAPTAGAVTDTVGAVPSLVVTMKSGDVARLPDASRDRTR